MFGFGDMGATPEEQQALLNQLAAAQAAWEAAASAANYPPPYDTPTWNKLPRDVRVKLTPLGDTLKALQKKAADMGLPVTGAASVPTANTANAAPSTGLPGWVMPVAIGGIVLLGAGAFFMLRRKKG